MNEEWTNEDLADVAWLLMWSIESSWKRNDLTTNKHIIGAGRH